MPSVNIPDPTGPYAVSATTFVRKISTPAVVGSSRIKRRNNLEPALILEEVAFVAYAPTTAPAPAGWFSSGSAKGIDWLSRPLSETTKGFSRFSARITGFGFPDWFTAVWSPFINIWGGFIKIPAYPNAPLLPPAQGNKWPLAILSHGLAGSRTTYSSLATHLASHGYVVISLEHRDGTGPAVFPLGRVQYYLNPDEIEWGSGVLEPEDPGLGKYTKGVYNSKKAIKLRVDQLEFRRREVYEAIHAFGEMVAGAEDHGGLQCIDGKNVDWDSWKGKVRMDKLDMIGHSFGGATVFSILANPPPPRNAHGANHDPLPIQRILALDPWMEPFASPGPKPHNTRASKKPELLVINSETFSLWTGHRTSLEEALRRFAPSRLLTVVRSTHFSFTDFPLLVPGRLQGADPKLLMDRILVLTEKFLDGKLSIHGSDLGLGETDWKTHGLEIVKDGLGRRRLHGDAGDIVVH